MTSEQFNAAKGIHAKMERINTELKFLQSLSTTTDTILDIPKRFQDLSYEQIKISSINLTPKDIEILIENKKNEFFNLSKAFQDL